ncbi:hypothetical protein WJX84_010879 [Apatococcus fuscideae]|uniref:Uncharacterized protein n=1 Tax=Apatococcus fuscideae TaxID=2026836 RepID=A0AAW1S567_9CHLO
MEGAAQVEAEFVIEVYRQPGAGRFKYCLRFKATKGNILTMQDVKAVVKNAHKAGSTKGTDENLALVQQPDPAYSFNFSTNVHCQRELYVQVSFIILLRGAPAQASPSLAPASNLPGETGLRLEEQDFVERALLSLRFHEHFGADHKPRVLTSVRVLMKADVDRYSKTDLCIRTEMKHAAMHPETKAAMGQNLKRFADAMVLEDNDGQLTMKRPKVLGP